MFKEKIIIEMKEVFAALLYYPHEYLFVNAVSVPYSSP